MKTVTDFRGQLIDGFIFEVDFYVNELNCSVALRNLHVFETE